MVHLRFHSLAGSSRKSAAPSSISNNQHVTCSTCPFIEAPLGLRSATDGGGRARTCLNATSMDTYGVDDSDLQPLDAYDAEFDDLAAPQQSRELKLIESYGLRIGTLINYQKPPESFGDEEGWGDSLYDDADGAHGSDDADSPLEEEGDDMLSAQVEYHFNARQRFEMEQLMDKAFELHHGQMERSHNAFATTNYFAQVLEDLSKVDDVSDSPARAIPSWIRAHFLFEENFDEWNDAAKAKMEDYNRRRAVDVDDNLLRQYEESDLEGEFDYDLLQLRAGKVSAKQSLQQDEDDDISGPGDSLAALLDVLPGVDGQANNEVDDYVDELMSATALEEDDLEPELEEAEIDF